MYSLKFILLIGFTVSASLSDSQQINRDKPINSDCSIKGYKLFGKIKFVTSNPDIKVEIVTSFPDLKVQIVENFPDRCGKWKIVDEFPDLRVQMVSSFPDIKIQFVQSFPGLDKNSQRKK